MKTLISEKLSESSTDGDKDQINCLLRDQTQNMEFPEEMEGLYSTQTVFYHNLFLKRVLPSTAVFPFGIHPTTLYCQLYSEVLDFIYLS